MLKDFIKEHFVSQASADKHNGYVEYGYGQVEPNHLSAQRTAQVYAQLPANPDINMLENGQFVKYDYAANANGIGEVNFTGAGEWMLVFNEIKLYRDNQLDCEFAMKKDDYVARVYTPYDWEAPEKEFRTRALDGRNLPEDPYDLEGASANTEGFKENIEKFTASPDPYELNYNEDPFHKLGVYQEKMMRDNTTMVPRVFKTNVGDIFTTNMVKEKTLSIGDTLTPGSDGILAKAGAGVAGVMKWQVVKIYTMPDGQKGVKLMRIQ